MLRPQTVVLLFCALFSCPAMAAELAPDPAWNWGTLPNGVRWGWMAHPNPPGRVAVRLHVRSGSLQETLPERGLAHYLEHMAFNGTTSFPPGTMITRLQALGVAFGAHSNAHTSFDETVYKLEMPDGSPANLDLALQLMGETAGGMLLLDKEIELERGIILSEMRDREGPGLRLGRKLLGSAYPGSIMPDRFPIGTPETVGGASTALIRGYWERFYRPDRMVITVAGSVDASVVPVITKHFAPLAATPSAADPDQGRVVPGTAVAIHDEPEANSLELHLSRTRSQTLPADTIAWRRTQRLQSLATRILNRRYAAAIELDPNGPLLGANAAISLRQNIGQVWVSAQVRSGSVAAAVAGVEHPLRSLILHGPTRTELALEVKAIRGELDTAVAQAGSRTSAGLAESTARAVAFGRIPMSPQQDRDLLVPWLAAVTPEDVREALATAWTSGARETLQLAGRGAGAMDERGLSAAWATATAAAVPPPAERAQVVWGYPDGTAAWIASAEPLPGIWTGRLDNGISAAIRTSASQPGSVIIQVRLNHAADGRQAGVNEWFARAFIDGGLGRHTARDLRELAAGTSLRGPGAGGSEDATALQISCQGKDVALACRLLAAFISDPGWRSDGAIPARTAWLEELAASRTDLHATMERFTQDLSTGGDIRRRSATTAEVQSLTWDMVRDWYQPILTQAPLSVQVSGDVDAAATRQAIAAGFGTLPARPPVPEQTLGNRAWMWQPRPWIVGEHRLRITAEKPSAQVRILWPSGDIYDIARYRRIGLLAGCLNERMRVRIREELGLGYSPGARHWGSDAWSGAGYVTAVVGPTPERVDEAIRELKALAAALPEQIDAALLAQVRTPTLRSLASTKARNEWWLGTVMARSAAQPFRFAWAGTIEQDIGSATVEELRALATEILRPEQAMILVGVAGP